MYIYFDQKLFYKIKTKLICISADDIFVIILKINTYYFYNLNTDFYM